MGPGLRAFVAVAVLATVVGTSSAAATTVRKGSGLSVGRACTYLSAKQVQQVFRSPVTVDPTNQGHNIVVVSECSWVVGPPGEPTGTLVAFDLYPFFPSPGQTAIDILESQRAADSLAQLTVVDTKVGQKAYLDLDRSVLAVAANKKFAFTLQWLSPGGPSTGGKLDAKTEKRLVALAKQVIARGPK